MGRLRIYNFGLLVMLTLTLSACANGAGMRGVAPRVGPDISANTAGGQLGLPSPSVALARVNNLRTSSAAPLARQGADFEANLAQLVSAVGFNAQFSPEWTGSASTFDTVAYAIYLFELPAYTGDPTLRIVWAVPPAEYKNLWIGFSKWEPGRWDWYPGPANGVLDLSATGFAQYVRQSTACEMLVAVVITGTDSCYLQELRIGAGVVAENWPLFGHDTKRTHRTSALGPETPDLHWYYLTHDAVVSSPAFGADGAVYIGSNDGFFYALNPDCTVRWQFDASAPVCSSPEVLPDGTVYVGCDDGRLCAVAPDGTEKWAFTAGGRVYSSPVVGFEGVVYFGSEDGSIYAVSPAGTECWTYATGGPVLSSAAIADDATLYIGSNDGYLYAINHDGTIKWHFQTTGPVQSSPAVGLDGTVYFGSDDGCCYAVAPDGSELWHYATGSSFGVSSPALSPDGTLYIGAEDGNVYALDTDPAISSPELRLKWQYAVGGNVHSSPALDGNGRIYVGGQDGIYAFDPASAGESGPLWQFPTSQPVVSSPAIDANGLLCVGCDDGSVYTIGPSMQYPPHCALDISPIHPNVDAVVTFDGSASYDPDGGTITKYEWDWEGDGTWDFDSGQDAVVEHVYATWGPINPTLRVTDDENYTGIASIAIAANSLPYAQSFWADPDGGYIPLGVTFHIRCTDPDGSIVKLAIDFGDGTGWYDLDLNTERVGCCYIIEGDYNITLSMTDDDGATDFAYTCVSAFFF